MNFLGIDVSKQKSDYFCMNEKGVSISGKGCSYENTKDGLFSLIEKLKSLSLTPENLLCGLEATGPFWVNIYFFLKQHRFNVVLLNPYQTRQYHKALRHKATTDRISAFVIADLLRSGRYLSSIVPEEKIESLKELTKMYFKLSGEKKSLKNQICALLAVVFPEYGKTFLANVLSIAARQILKKYPTARDIATCSVKKIEKIVRSIKGNNVSRDEIKLLIETAKDSIYSGFAHQTKCLSMKILIEQLELTLSSLAKVKQAIDDILSPSSSGSFPGENLLSINGVGKNTIAFFLSVVGEKGQYFPSCKHLIGYIGFYPQIFESGQTKKENIISIQGPPYIRQALYLAAVSCIKHNPELKTLYDKKISQGKAKKQALIYVSKKLAHMMLSMLKTGQYYLPERVFVPPTALKKYTNSVPASFKSPNFQ